MRQVVAKACNILGERRLVPSALIGTLALIKHNVPLDQNALDTLMRQHGFAEKSFHIGGIKEAAKIFGLPFPWHIDRRGKQPLVLSPEFAGLPEQLIRAARREVAHHGAIVIDQVAEFANALAGRPVPLTLVRAILARDRSMAVLRDPSEWWWRPASAAAGRNRLINTASKVVAAAGTLSLRELRDAVRRHVRSGFIAPPLDVLRALLVECQRFTVLDEKVSSTPSAEHADYLSDTERLLLRIFEDAGPVVASHKMSALGNTLGLNENSMNMYRSYSPILWRPAPGYYAVVGATIPVGLIEELRAGDGQVYGRSNVESGWTTDRQLVLCRRLTTGMYTSGLISIPAAIETVVQGSFRLLGLGTQPLEPIDVRGATLFNLRKFFRLYGAEVHDTLVLAFDPLERRCRAWLGAPGLADEVQLGGIDALYARLTAAPPDEAAA